MWGTFKYYMTVAEFSKSHWLNKDIHVDISLHKSIGKKDDNAKIQKLLTMEHISKLSNSFIRIYTQMVLRQLLSCYYLLRSIDLD